MAESKHTPDQVAIITGFFGIKCDAEGCGWSDMAVTREQYLDYRNRPCPSCGANLLTDEDWAIVLSAEAAAQWINNNAKALSIDTAAPAEPFDLSFDDLKALMSATQPGAQTDD